jgi:hypothetical protein
VACGTLQEAVRPWARHRRRPRGTTPMTVV